LQTLSVFGVEKEGFNANSQKSGDLQMKKIESGTGIAMGRRVAFG